MSETNLSNILENKPHELKEITYKAFSVFDVRRWCKASVRVAKCGKQTSNILVTYGKITSNRLINYGKQASDRLVAYGGQLCRQTLDTLDSQVYQKIKGFYVPSNDIPCSRTGIAESVSSCCCIVCRAQQSGHQLTVVQEAHEANNGPSGSWIFVPKLSDSDIQASHQNDNMLNFGSPEDSNTQPKIPEKLSAAGLKEQQSACRSRCAQKSNAKCSSKKAVEIFPRSEVEIGPSNVEDSLQSVPENVIQTELENTFQPEVEDISVSATKRATRSESTIPKQTATKRTLRSKMGSSQQLAVKKTMRSKVGSSQQLAVKRALRSKVGSSQQSLKKRTLRSVARSCPVCAAKKALESEAESSQPLAAKGTVRQKVGSSQQSTAEPMTGSSAKIAFQSGIRSSSKASSRTTKRISESPLIKSGPKRTKK